jgi:DNA-binding response OmpR family regulator
MSASGARLRVIVISSDDELLGLLRRIGEDAGSDVLTARVDEIGADPKAIQEFLRRHDPKVVVYDVSPPYAENWTLFRRVREAELLSGSRRQFVVTTPNKRALEEQVGATRAIQLTGDQADRQAIGEAIRRGMLV